MVSVGYCSMVDGGKGDGEGVGRWAKVIALELGRDKGRNWARFAADGV